MMMASRPAVVQLPVVLQPRRKEETRNKKGNEAEQKTKADSKKVKGNTEATNKDTKRYKQEEGSIKRRDKKGTKTGVGEI